jgi:hypothetical protein
MPEMRADTHVGFCMKRKHFYSILNEVGVCQRNFSATHQFRGISFTDSRNCYIQTGRQCKENKRICDIQAFPGGKDLTSGECSLSQTIPI